MIRGRRVMALLVAPAALVLSACAPNAVVGSSSEPPRTVTVSATGRAEAVPDAARASLTVEVTDPASAEKAQQQAAGTTTAVLQALTVAGVADRDVATQGVSVTPAYTYTADGGEQLLGYRATQSLTVTLRDLTTAGATLDAVVAAGGNQVRVDALSTFVTDPTVAAGAARAQAVEVARAQAEQYAELLGFSLAEVASVTESSPAVVLSPVPMADAMAAPEKASTPIEPGTTEVSVTLTIAWSIR